MVAQPKVQPESVQPEPVQEPEKSQEIVYPDCDGNPMSDNTKQFRWIVTIQQNLEWLFAHDPNVFIAGDLLWYPVQGEPKIRTAPDVMVALGRPKGDRGSYKQWEENGITPQVVFEILSPGNTQTEMNKKLVFYSRHGVEEYYLYDPDGHDLSGWIQVDQRLDVIDPMQNWVSPRLGIRFEWSETDLQIFRPDGKRFLSYVEIAEQASQAELKAEQAELKAEQAELKAEQAELKAERLAEQLRAAGIDPDVL